MKIGTARTTRSVDVCFQNMAMGNLPGFPETNSEIAVALANRNDQQVMYTKCFTIPWTDERMFAVRH